MPTVTTNDAMPPGKNAMGGFPMSVEVAAANGGTRTCTVKVERDGPPLTASFERPPAGDCIFHGN